MREFVTKLLEMIRYESFGGGDCSMNGCRFAFFPVDSNITKERKVFFTLLLNVVLKTTDLRLKVR